MLVFNTDLAEKRMSRCTPTQALHTFYQHAAAGMLQRMSFLKGEHRRTLIFAPHVVNAFEYMGDVTWVHTFSDAILQYGVGQYDHIISFHHLHWMNDVPGFLKQCGELLAPNGWLIGVCVGGRTLCELRESFDAVAPEFCLQSGAWHLSNGRMSPMMRPRDVAGLLQRAQLGAPVCDIERDMLVFRDVNHLIHELQSNGLTHAPAFESSPFRCQERDQMAAYYAAHFQNPEGPGVLATVESIFFTAQSPRQNGFIAPPSVKMLEPYSEGFEKEK